MASDDFTEQFAAALAKSMSVVAEAGGSAPAIGRMTIYVTEIETYRARRAEIGQVYRERMGSHFPAMSLVEVTRLVHPRAKVEIEVTAIITDGGA
jgi:enamine deaminase RidA (YjgF/YER057c/UK114 family)